MIGRNELDNGINYILFCQWPVKDPKITKSYFDMISFELGRSIVPIPRLRSSRPYRPYKPSNVWNPKSKMKKFWNEMVKGQGVVIKKA